MDKITSIIFEALKPDLKALVEEAVLSALEKAHGAHRYPDRVNVNQASEITGYSKNTLYQMHSQGKIPAAVKIGAKLMFKTKELQEWVEQGGSLVQ